MIETEKNAATLAICIGNGGYPASLELHALYELLAVGEPELGLLRVVDESGEDYLYPEQNFVPVSEVVPPYRRIPDGHLTDLERAARGFIEDHSDLLEAGTPLARSRAFTQGSAIYVALTEETVGSTNRAARVKRRLARAFSDHTTPPKRLMQLEKAEEEASRAYVQSSVVNQEMHGFLKHVHNLLPSEHGGSPEDR